MKTFKNYLALFAALLQVAPLQALAIPETDRAIVERGRNILVNSGAESGKSSVTASGGTFTIGTTSANTFEGKAYFTWDSSSASQTLTFAPQSINGLAGSNGEATCFIQVPSGTATHTMGIWDGTNLTNTKTISNPSGSTIYIPTTINFIFGSSGSAGIRFTSVNANEPSINIDKCYLGPSTNIQQVAQAKLLGGVVVTGCAANWQTGSTIGTSYTDFTAASGCTYTTFGEGLAPATNIPAVKFASIPAGNLLIQFDGRYESNNGGYSYQYQFYDGTNASRETSHVNGFGASDPAGSATSMNHSISYTTDQSNITLRLRVKSASAGGPNDAKVYNSTLQPAVFKVFWFPGSQSQVVTTLQQRAPTVQKFTSGSGTYTTPAGVTFIKVRMVGGGGGGGGGASTLAGTTAGGTGGNTTFGSSLLTANGGVGGGANSVGGAGGSASIAAPAIGTALQGGAGQGGTDGTSTHATGGAGAASPFGGNGGSTANAAGIAAIANSGSGGGAGGANSGSTQAGGAGGGAGGYVDAIISTPSTTYSYAVGAAGTAGSAGTAGYAGAAGGSGYIEVTEYYSQSAPIFIGSVTSGTSGAERIERFRVDSSCTSTPCTISSQSGSWLTSITRTATGKYTLNYPSTTWSAAPTCTFSFGTTVQSRLGGVPSTSSTLLETYNSSFTATDTEIYGICIGPK